MRGGSEPGAGGKPTDVERLVAGAAADEEDDPRWRALLRVLTAAARGAAVDPEREQAALIAFRAATTARRDRHARAPRPARCLPARRRGRSVRSARALAGGLAAVFALCGVAVAAGTGVLSSRGSAAHGGPPPAPVARTAAPAPTTTGAAAPTAGPTAPGRRAVPAPSAPAAATTGPTTAPPPGRTRPPAPRKRPPAAVRALCRVYLAAVRDGRTPAARLTARLQQESGGSRRVAAYCRALLATAPTAAPK